MLHQLHLTAHHTIHRRIGHEPSKIEFGVIVSFHSLSCVNTLFLSLYLAMMQVVGAAEPGASPIVNRASPECGHSAFRRVEPFSVFNTTIWYLKFVIIPTSYLGAQGKSSPVCPGSTHLLSNRQSGMSPPPLHSIHLRGVELSPRKWIDFWRVQEPALSGMRTSRPQSPVG